MKINVIQGKFVNENSFLSLVNLFNNLFNKTSLIFKFYSSDDYNINDLGDEEYKEEILKKIKFDHADKELLLEIKVDEYDLFCPGDD